MHINIKLLVVFALVAEHRSFRKAAAELDRSQSVVSLQIRQLEDQLGVQLFHRTTRQVVLSSAGEALLMHVQHGLTEIREGVETTLEAAARERTRIMIGCAEMVATAILAPVIAALRDAFPTVTVYARELSTNDVLTAIASQGIDFGITPQAPNRNEFRFEHIFTDEIMAVVPATSDIAALPKISLHAFARFHTILPAESSALRVELERRAEGQHAALDFNYETSQLSTLLSLVRAGLGCAALPRSVLANLGVEAEIRTVPFDPPINREICIVTLAGRALTPTTRAFVALATRVIREQLESATSPAAAR